MFNRAEILQRHKKLSYSNWVLTAYLLNEFHAPFSAVCAGCFATRVTVILQLIHNHEGRLWVIMWTPELCVLMFVRASRHHCLRVLSGSRTPHNYSVLRNCNNESGAR